MAMATAALFGAWGVLNANTKGTTKLEGREGRHEHTLPWCPNLLCQRLKHRVRRVAVELDLDLCPQIVR